jgi:hypothetical protein
MALPDLDSRSDNLPPGLVRPCPSTSWQPSLFKMSLKTALARAGVSVDDVRRWHGSGWLSFDEKLADELDEFDDPRVWEILIVRDVVRCGLADAQIEVLFSKLPRPFTFQPDSLAYTFRHGWVCVLPPVKAPEPSDVIEEHLDGWIEECDEETLERLRAKITETLQVRSESNPVRQN